MTSQGLPCALLLLALPFPSVAQLLDAGARGTEVLPRRVVSITTTSAEARQAFLSARDKLEDGRAPEALIGFQRALALDPSFALAMAYVGFNFGGPQGLSALERAIDLAATLPAAERHFIEFMLAVSQADEPKSDRIIRELMQEAPDDWRVFYQFGEIAFGRRDWERAIAAYRRALVLYEEPKRRCPSFNRLGYAEAHVGRYDLAEAAVKRCIELEPDAPNYVDTLGDIELAANHLPEADEAFHKSASLAPDFWPAWAGIATADFASGNWDRGYKALDHVRANSLLSMRLHADALQAWALFTDNKPAQALQRVDAFEATAKAAKEPGQYYFALAALVRASMLNELGRYSEALEATKRCLERLRTSGLPAPAWTL